MFVCMYICMYVCKYVDHTYIYIYLYEHTHLLHLHNKQEKKVSYIAYTSMHKLLHFSLYMYAHIDSLIC